MPLAGGQQDDAAREREREQWVGVKEMFNAAGILLFADESMRTSADVDLLAPYVNGVNIKLEKCGGLRGALQAVEEARRHEMLVWFGCMVGSNVNSSTTAHMFSLACCSDLDGALLVTPASQLFTGGFQYTAPLGNIQLPSTAEGYGIGVAPKPEFARTITSI
jgi:L-alanine-DL-glutamate epimerase-like enolase superfamily enzyme